MKAVLLFCAVITIRGRSGFRSIFPVLRLLRNVSSRNQPPPFWADEERTDNLERSYGRVKPTMRSPLLTARQKTRLTNELRFESLSRIWGGKRRVSGTFAGLLTYFSRTLSFWE